MGYSDKRKSAHEVSLACMCDNKYQEFSGFLSDNHRKQKSVLLTAQEAGPVEALPVTENLLCEVDCL